MDEFTNTFKHKNSEAMLQRNLISLLLLEAQIYSYTVLYILGFKDFGSRKNKLKDKKDGVLILNFEKGAGSIFVL